MKLLVYAVYDKAISAYSRPFFCMSPAHAMRMFGDNVNNSGSEMNAHPEDYSCFKLGEWDDNTGELVSCEPVCLARAHEIIEKE